MSTSADELARELSKLQQEFRAYAQRPEFSYAELSAPAAGSFLEHYRSRTAEIQNALARLH